LTTYLLYHGLASPFILYTPHISEPPQTGDCITGVFR